MNRLSHRSYGTKSEQCKRRKAIYVSEKTESLQILLQMFWCVQNADMQLSATHLLLIRLKRENLDRGTDVEAKAVIACSHIAILSRTKL